MKPLEVGVFLSSLGISDVPQALRKAKEIGFNVVQLGPETYYNLNEPSKKENLKEAIRETGIEVTTVFAGFPGEDYADVPTVIKSVGFTATDKVKERIELSKKIADLTAELGVKIMAAHVGFIPEDENSPLRKQMLDAIGEVVDYCDKKGLLFAFETGQEKPRDLLNFIKKLNRKNTRVNFDTVNLILYGKAQTLEGIEILKDYIINVHAKDGSWPREKNKIGEQFPLGKGEANIKGCVKKLIEVGYKGPLIIEVEVGEDRIGNILKAKEYLEEAKKESGL